MTDDPASWPDWRPPTEFPRVGVTVLVVARDATGSAWVDFGERLPGGQWRIDDRIAMESDVVEVVAWMPVPPPDVVAVARDATGSAWVDFGARLPGGQWRIEPVVRCWCGTEGCLMPGEHLESECHTLEMVEAAEEAEARETIKAKSYPTKEVKNQASDPKGKT